MTPNTSVQHKHLGLNSYGKLGDFPTSFRDTSKIGKAILLSYKMWQSFEEIISKMAQKVG